VAYCGKTGTIYAYSAGFERGRIEELAIACPQYRKPLMAIVSRIADLLPVMREYYYHPAMQGSWSIKAVLPAIAPELDYATLSGVKDGGMAMVALWKYLNGGA
jgi:hypothetical protein